MTNHVRHVKFWLIGNDKLVGVRGWCEETEDRYELSQEDGQWDASVVVPKMGWPDDWGFRHIASGDLFSCLVAVENHAKSEVEDEITNNPEHWDTED